MKKGIQPLFFLLLTMVATFPPPFRKMEAAGGKKVYVNLPAVNVRAGPSGNYRVAGVVSKGDELTLLDSVRGWMKVKTLKGLTGWVSRDAVTMTPPASVVLSNLKEEIDRLKREKTGLEERFSEVEKENLSLKEENRNALSEKEDLERKVASIRDMKVFLWAAIGILLLLIGWFLGFITGILREKAEERRLDQMRRSAGR